MMRKNTLQNIAYYVAATLCGFFILMPFFWMASTSLKSRGALMAIPIQWIPEEPTLEAYIKIFTLFPFARAILNSTVIAVLTTAVTVLSSSMAAYAFAKLDFKGREKLFFVYLATMMIPIQVTTIPLFIVLTKIKLVNTFAGLVLPSVFNAFAVFLIRQQIMTIPDDYIDAAIMDGASYSKTFFNLVMPMCKPILITLAIITFMGAWNDYYWPLVVLNDKNKMTLTLALNLLNGQYSSDYSTLMAGSLVSMLPILALYAFAQKYFQTGLQLGGLKG